jgi:AcrR family transcriptional regulator
VTWVATEAAVTEFGEHGYAGARISAIASRAGVNQQLISYYFDGEGLYRALQDRWRTISASANRDLPAAGHEIAVITGYSRESVRRIQRDAGIEPNDRPHLIH